MMNILIVGGTWDNNEGRPSGLINRLYESMKKYIVYPVHYTVHNGGNYNNLEKIIENTVDYNYVFWFANVIDNSLEKIRDVKKYAPKCMLITSKRNDDNKYNFEELLQRALTIKANLCFEFSKINDMFNIKIFDPLGCVWYNGTNIDNAVAACIDRLSFTSKVTRRPSIQIDTELPYIDWSVHDLKFLEYVKKSADEFHKLMCLPPDVKRFVGNASLRFKEPTRCMNGFPAIKKSEYEVLISRRNVDKTGITTEDFVPCYINDNGDVTYFGEHKPSVDSPVQVRLFRELKNIKYILHGHCYIENTAMTNTAIPCGAIEETHEVLKFIDMNYGTRNNDFYLINLKGHGCLIMANESTLHIFDQIKYRVRKLPEIMY